MLEFWPRRVWICKPVARRRQDLAVNRGNGRRLRFDTAGRGVSDRPEPGGDDAMLVFNVIELLDRLDEGRARRIRERYGRRGMLLSWQRDASERWLARLSSPEHPRTIELTGPTRIGAIARASRSLARRLAPDRELNDSPSR